MFQAYDNKLKTYKQALIDSKFAWLIWLIASLFYSMEFFQRVSPSVMAMPIMQSLQMNQQTFAIIISLYFYACAAVQIPVGYILDRYRLRYVLALACLMVSLGTLIFSLSDHIIYLVISRLLVGVGSAFAFIGVLKLSSNWFSLDHYPFVVGLTNTVGILGAILGEAPYAKLVNDLGWRQSFFMISIIGLFISVLMLLFIRGNPKFNNNKTMVKSSYNLKCIFDDKQTWLIAIYAGLMVAPIIAFAELWGVPFFTSVYHISSVKASTLNTSIFIGIAIGGPVNGLFSRYFQSRKVIMGWGNFIALLSIIVIIFVTNIPLILLSCLLFIFGFATSSMLLAFSLNKDRHPIHFAAVVTGFTNMIILIFGAFYQDITGFLLKHLLFDLNLTPEVLYQVSLSTLPITLMINLCLLYFIASKRQISS